MLQWLAIDWHLKRENKKRPQRGRCGAGGSRTRVQTGSQPAFYMFMRWLVVGLWLASVQPTIALSSVFLPVLREITPASPSFAMLRSGRRKAGLPGEQQTA